MKNRIVYRCIILEPVMNFNLINEHKIVIFVFNKGSDLFVKTGNSFAVFV